MRVMVLVTAMAVILAHTVSLAAADRQAEIDEYINGLASPSIFKRITTAKEITNSAITDERLYDKVEQRLLESAQVEYPTSEQSDEISWLCKALAASGNEKYRPTIQKIADDPANAKIGYYCRQSLDLIADYRSRNAEINRSDTAFSGLSAEENRIVNMLRSDDLKLKRDGAKIVSRGKTSNAIVYDVVAEELLAHYQDDEYDNLSVDTMAWLCKALSSSRNDKYASTLQTVMKNSSSWKLQNHARKALELIGAR